MAKSGCRKEVWLQEDGEGAEDAVVLTDEHDDQADLGSCDHGCRFHPMSGRGGQAQGTFLSEPPRSFRRL
jgi:hypothetical protein